MHSKYCVLLLMFLPISSWGVGAMVPVQDPNVAKGVGVVNSNLTQVISNGEKTLSGLQAINETLGTNQKQLNNTNQALVNALLNLGKGSAQVSELRKNSELYDPSMGAKPRAACATLDAIAALKVADKLERVALEQSLDRGYKHVERGRFLSQSDDIATDTGTRITKIRQAEQGVIEKHGLVAMTMSDTSSLPIPDTAEEADPFEVVESKLMNIAVPNPVRIEPGTYDSEEAFAEDRRKNAGKFLQMDRQKVITEQIADHMSDRRRVVSTGWMSKFLGPNIDIPFDDEELIGRDDARRFMNTVRMRDEGWVLSTTGSSNTVGLMKDQALMMAQSLENEQETISLLKDIRLLLTLIYANDIGESGIPEIGGSDFSN